MPLFCRLHESSSDLVNRVYMYTRLQLSFAMPEAICLVLLLVHYWSVPLPPCCTEKGIFPVAICCLTKPSYHFSGILMMFDTNLTWLFLKQHFNLIFYLKQTLKQLYLALEVLLWMLSQSLLLPSSQYLLNWVLGWEVGGFPHLAGKTWENPELPCSSQTVSHKITMIY